MTDRPPLQDPRKQYPAPPFPEQPQAMPGLARKMDPVPDHGEESYRGSGRLTGRKALVTGGDSGIGRAAAIAFAREGADVAISYLPEEEADAKEVIALIEAEGRAGIALPGDIKDEAWCRELVEKTVSGLGGLDILVINAGRQQYREKIEDLSTDDFDKTMKTNLYALHWIAQAAVPHLPAGGFCHHDGLHPGLSAFTDPSRLCHDQGRHRRLHQGTREAAYRAGHPRQCRGARPGLDRACSRAAGSQMRKSRISARTAISAGRVSRWNWQPVFVLLASTEASFINGEVYGVTGGKGVG